MRIEITEKNSDHDLPVLDIYLGNQNEAFRMGRLFEKMVSLGLCVWSTEDGIRIPLSQADDLGLVDKSGA